MAYDGEENDANSPYVTALLKHIGTPGEDVQSAFNRIRAAVIEITKKDSSGEEQTPQVPFCSVGLGENKVYLAADPGEADWEKTQVGDRAPSF